MLQEAKDLQNEAVTKLVNVLEENKKEFTFKAPTGSGKTYMMADFMNRMLGANEKLVFIVSTLSKSNLAEQNFNSFKDLTETKFPNLKPYLINSDSSGEASLFIPKDCNVYVLPRDLYKDKAKLKKEGTFLNFLDTLTSPIVAETERKTIYLIKDECHILTSNLDELENYFSKIINFSATPKLSRNQNSDVEITNLDAENAKIIKKIERGDDDEKLEDALNKFEQIKADYTNLLGVNPCLIIQISNKDKAEEELKNTIMPALTNHQDLKWVYITGDEKSCDTNDSGFKKLSVSKWKDYMKQPLSTISVIIFKMVISEGWDIPRACMLYQIRDSQSKQLDEQVMGRVRRNPRLLDFETLSDEAKLLAMTAWIWGIVPETTGGTQQVKLIKNYGIEKAIRVKPTKLQNITAEKAFDVDSYIKSLQDKKGASLTHASIFDLYRSIQKCDNQIQSLCWSYGDDYYKWRNFVENLSNIKTQYDAYICDYEKSMVACDDVSFPSDSCFVESDRNLLLDDWVWYRKDYGTDFSFDSDAEKLWAHVLEKLQHDSIAKTSNLEFGSDSNKFLWGKNFPFNSEIKFEYYLDGIHSSYPDFVMKDKSGQIHIFEVKSVNKSSYQNINEDEYKQKVNALKECYKEASKKTGHIFYLPILENSEWKIIRLKAGFGDEITKKQFIDSLKVSSYPSNEENYGVKIAAEETERFLSTN